MIARFPFQSSLKRTFALNILGILNGTAAILQNIEYIEQERVLRKESYGGKTKRNMRNDF
jgi:hypothetical protein